MRPSGMNADESNALLQKTRQEIIDRYANSGIPFDGATVRRELSVQWAEICGKGIVVQDNSGAIPSPEDTKKIGITKTEDRTWFVGKNGKKEGGYTIDELADIVDKDNNLMVFGPSTQGGWMPAKDILELKKKGIFDKKASVMESLSPGSTLSHTNPTTMGGVQVR